MKTFLMAASGAVLVALSVAACSTGTNAAPSPTPIPTVAVQPNDRAYTKNDLSSILNSVNTRLGLGGTVATQDGPQTAAVDALSAFLGGNAATIKPASCVDLLKSDSQLVAKLGSEGVVAGTLSSSQLNVIATAVSGATLPDSLTSNFTASQRSILSSCKHLTIAQTVDGQESAVSVDFTPLTVTTNASQSVGFRESFVITSGGAGSSSSRTTVEAIDGNLLIFVSGVLAQDETTLEKAVNAVVAAAKK
ncbi:MAG TPA: hypothetical protein VK537_09305 [Galbitalea sp.]|nr:hypothetical protein [Galbitalea sp.]